MLLEIGRIGRPHGVKGEVAVHLITDREDRLAVGSRLTARETTLTVLASRRHIDRWLVTFAEIGDRTAAERWSSTVLYAEPVDDPDALWVHDLIGSRVVELGGLDRGECVAVIDNPAHALLELDSGALVPVTFVIDNIDGVITIDPPEGLFE